MILVAVVAYSASHKKHVTELFVISLLNIAQFSKKKLIANSTDLLYKIFIEDPSTL